MIKAQSSDRSLAIEILKQAFADVPSMKAMLRNNKARTLHGLMDYSVNYCFRRDGVFFNEEKNCVALCYLNSKSKNNLSDTLSKLILILASFSIRKLPAIHRHIKYIKEQRPESEYLYFWFLGAINDSKQKSTTRQLIYDVFNWCEAERLPIYAETTMIKNKKVYEHFGFETYREWHNPELDITVWFMRKKPRK